MIITITGKLGSGKSEICNILKANYGFVIYSTGNIHRMLAKEKNLSTIEFNKLLNENKMDIDKIIDNKTIDIAKTSTGDMAFDSRLAWHFVPKSFKVFAYVDENEAGRRVFLARKDSVEKYDSIEEATKKLRERRELERKRFLALYNIDIDNYKNYDFIIDTTNITPLKAVEEILTACNYQNTKQQ